MSDKIERIPTDVIFRSNPDGIMPEKQIEAILWGFFYRVCQTRDRRGGAVAMGEMPKNARVWNEETRQWDSEAGKPIYASPSVNRATGLPESASSLLPNHRALYGPDLATKLIIPPEDFVCICLYTDDIPSSQALAQDDPKRFVALAYKPKFKTGVTGRPLAIFLCRKCKTEWEGELPDTTYPCLNPKCRADGLGFEHGLDDSAPVVDSRICDNWSDDEVRAVKANTRTLKRVLNRLRGEGYFDLKPKIDEHEADLGTTILHDPQDDEEILGFKITGKGVRYAEEFVKVHPELVKGHHILEAMGPALADKAPQWIQAEYRKGRLVEEIK